MLVYDGEFENGLYDGKGNYITSPDFWSTTAIGVEAYTTARVNCMKMEYVPRVSGMKDN